jgi:hypothetical protein
LEKKKQRTGNEEEKGENNSIRHSSRNRSIFWLKITKTGKGKKKKWFPGRKYKILDLGEGN